MRIFNQINLNKTRLCVISKRYLSALKSVLKEVKWEAVIGLEVHAQIQSASKLFSAAENKFDAPPNTLVSHFDAALPGTLPVLNKTCVEAAIKAGIALQCKINKISYFDRKHYFYPDSPQGYQITQAGKPIAVDGEFTYATSNGLRTVKIMQIQLEQDTGKTLTDDKEINLIDLNRAGVGLLEIVTAPNFTSGIEAEAFFYDIRQALRTLGVCEGKVAEGQLRIDANISVRRPNQAIGVRSEVKNIPGGLFLRKAIEYEIDRQINLITEGEEVVNETRFFDNEKEVTVSMRDKEVKQDYRFLPEPNLPPLVIFDDDKISSQLNFVNINDVIRTMPDALPTVERNEIMERCGISLEDSNFLMKHNLQTFFLQVVKNLNSPKSFDLLHQLMKHNNKLFQNGILTNKSSTHQPICEVLGLLENYSIMMGEAVGLIEEYFKTGQISPPEISTISNEDEIQAIIDKYLLSQDLQRILKKYKLEKPKSSGNKKAINYVLLGVKRTNKKLHNAVAKRLIIATLNNLKSDSNK